MNESRSAQYAIPEAHRKTLVAPVGGPAHWCIGFVQERLPHRPKSSSPPPCVGLVVKFLAGPGSSSTHHGAHRKPLVAPVWWPVALAMVVPVGQRAPFVGRLVYPSRPSQSWRVQITKTIPLIPEASITHPKRRTSVCCYGSIVSKLCGSPRPIARLASD